MAEQLYALTAADVGTLKELIAAWKRGDLGRPLQNSRRVLPQPTQAYVAVCPSTGIPAMVGTVAGSADVTLQTISSGGTMNPTTVTETVYNLALEDVANDAVIMCKREALTGRLVVDFERCT